MNAASLQIAAWFSAAAIAAVIGCVLAVHAAGVLRAVVTGR